MSTSTDGMPPSTAVPPEVPPADRSAHDGDRSGWSADRILRRAASTASNYLGVGLALLLFAGYLTLTEDHFATVDNLTNILETNAVLLIVATGLTFILLTGGFDLSLGGLLALSSVGLYKLLDSGLPVGVAIVLVVLGATVIGLMTNGFFIAFVGLSFIVVTLASSYVFRGVAQIQTEGQSQSLFDQEFLITLGSGRIAGLPWPVVVALTVFLVALVVLRYSGYGRMIYAVGGNPEAARVAGINVTAVRMSVFGVAAGCTGLAAVIDAGRLASASPSAGAGIELTAGAAVLLGGTTFLGGRGTLLGTLLGVLFLGVLRNGITLIGMQAFWENVVAGGVLVAALLLDRLKRRGPAAAVR